MSTRITHMKTRNRRSRGLFRTRKFEIMRPFRRRVLAKFIARSCNTGLCRIMVCSYLQMVCTGLYTKSRGLRYDWILRGLKVTCDVTGVRIGVRFREVLDSVRGLRYRVVSEFESSPNLYANFYTKSVLDRAVYNLGINLRTRFYTQRSY